MKVVAINGSPREGGNTERLIKTVFGELEAEGFETESIRIGGQALRGCVACMKCWEKKNERCAIDDQLNAIIQKIKQADGLIVGSPTYFANVTAETAAFIDRAGMVTRANGDLLKRKPAAAVVAVRRAGAIQVFNAINQFFLIGQMIVVGSSYWNIGVGRQPGEVEHDEEGAQTMRTLGKNIAWVIKRLR